MPFVVANLTQDVFDSAQLQKESHLPPEFVWPEKDLIGHCTAIEDLNAPIIDLKGFVSGDPVATAQAAELVKSACSSHGFFQVINHGVDRELIQATYDGGDQIFRLPTTKKVSIRRKPHEVDGYSGAHADRYSSKLPWKETYSFWYDLAGDKAEGQKNRTVVDYFQSTFGEEFEHSGCVYQKFCEEMKHLTMVLMELLAVSLGVQGAHYKNFFEDGKAIMRCNLYPYCKDAARTMGTGPHYDPTSLTILHQDHVGGLQVFADGRWQSVRPCPDAFVINIGDTLTVLTNGLYKSCLHRAVVNSSSDRRSLVFFVSPSAAKVLTPPAELLGQRKYPDFTWSDLLNFTQYHHRVDEETLESFLQWWTHRDQME